MAPNPPNNSKETKDLFHGRYRTQSDRLQDWDYAAPGAYFVTICTQHKRPFFGEVVDDAVRLTPIGQIAEQEWTRNDTIRPNVSLDEFIIMPNHLHGIIFLSEDVETFCKTSLPRPDRDAQAKTMSDISPRSGSLGVIIRSFKGAVTRWARTNGYPHFAWQRGYYDHIIRNPRDLDRIRRYIQSNPAKWALDKYHVDG
jgi:REP element-mobilizing transposase RayT